jgi:hypothetical protein
MVGALEAVEGVEEPNRSLPCLSVHGVGAEEVAASGAGGVEVDGEEVMT